jgi:hypothetical protein
MTPGRRRRPHTPYGLKEKRSDPVLVTKSHQNETNWSHFAQIVQRQGRNSSLRRESVASDFAARILRRWSTGKVPVPISFHAITQPCSPPSTLAKFWFAMDCWSSVETPWKQPREAVSTVFALGFHAVWYGRCVKLTMETCGPTICTQSASGLPPVQARSSPAHDPLMTRS